MNKIMSLDVGEKRIGIALSDYLHMIATPHSYISRVPEITALETIEKIAKENNVEEIVVGLPINMDGTQGHQAQDCIGFADKLKDKFKIVMEDERLTSETAEENLRAKKIDFKKEKGLVDMESACIILDQYLSR